MDWQALGNLLHELKWAIAGFFGALVASFFHRDELESKSDFIMFFLSGWACAYFLTGLVAKYFSIDADNLGAVGFLLGAFGGSLISAIIRGIRKADVAGIIKQLLAGSK